MNGEIITDQHTQNINYIIVSQIEKKTINTYLHSAHVYSYCKRPVNIVSIIHLQEWSLDKELSLDSAIKETTKKLTITIMPLNVSNHLLNIQL